eukprot:12903961-Prorocentrum_lima.AAC.1
MEGAKDMFANHVSEQSQREAEWRSKLFMEAGNRLPRQNDQDHSTHVRYKLGDVQHDPEPPLPRPRQAVKQ